MDITIVQFVIGLVFSVGGITGTFFKVQADTKKDIHAIHLLINEERDKIKSYLRDEIVSIDNRLDVITLAMNKDNSGFQYSDEKILLKLEQLEKDIRIYYNNTDKIVKYNQEINSKQIYFLTKEYSNLVNYINKQITTSQYVTRVESILDFNNMIDTNILSNLSNDD